MYYEKPTKGKGQYVCSSVKELNNMYTCHVNRIRKGCEKKGDYDLQRDPFPDHLSDIVKNTAEKEVCIESTPKKKKEKRNYKMESNAKKKLAKDSNLYKTTKTLSFPQGFLSIISENMENKRVLNGIIFPGKYAPYDVHKLCDVADSL